MAITESINPSLLTPTALRSFLNDIHSDSHGTGSRNAEVVCNTFFTHDIELQYVNYPPVQGLEVVTGFFKMQFGVLDAMTHDIPFFDYSPSENKLYQPARVGYLVKGDDREKEMIYVNAISIFWLREEDGRLKIRKAQIALDATEVMERVKQKGVTP